MTTEDVSAVWNDYLTSVQRLDSVRREAASAAAAEAEAVASARTELPVVQARIGIQAGRLLEAALQAGTAPPPLVPNTAEQKTAAQTVAGGPAVVLAALRQARSTVDVADAALARLDQAEQPQAVRNLIAYAPAAGLATLIQFGFALLVDDRTRTFYAGICGLIMAAMLFGAAWVALGIVQPRKPKTPEIGALVCFSPVVLVTLLFAII
ncbi:hypothetical protein [Catelliglobosispora koreensis]|uniref:hypothetical protein n=1 Tax=Catelliglobosispora koreensis TaxID=129052 RepID=UPI00035C10C8|nr:hypothetical protein [Catelliglobosispora koreensis]